MYHFRTIKSCAPVGIVLLLYLLIAGNYESSWADETAVLSPGEQAETVSIAGVSANDAQDDNWKDEDNWDDEWGEEDLIADPLEPINRLFFHFNDKLYYWVLKPVAKVYGGILPEELQIGFRNFFTNLRAPIRAVNSLLQGKPRDSFNEVVRFTLNSTAGIFGMGDFAWDVFGLQSSYEDLGQTFAHYGAGGGFYIVWPFLGPSNLRDSIGLVGDSFLHPIILLDVDTEVVIGAWIFEKINYTALTLGDYELFTETALDPYTAVQDAYQQYRKGLIEDK